MRHIVPIHEVGKVASQIFKSKHMVDQSFRAPVPTTTRSIIRVLVDVVNVMILRNQMAPLCPVRTRGFHERNVGLHGFGIASKRFHATRDPPIQIGGTVRALRIPFQKFLKVIIIL